MHDGADVLISFSDTYYFHYKSSASVPNFNFRSAIGFQSVIGTLVSTSQILPPFHPPNSPVPSNVIPDLRISFCTSTFCWSEN